MPALSRIDRNDSRSEAPPPARGALRRAERPPAAVMVLAPAIGLVLWGGLIALVLL